MSCSHVPSKPRHQAWTLSPHWLRGQPGFLLTPPEYSWLWLSPLSSANLSLGNTNCLACSPLSHFTLCPPGPQGSEFVSPHGSWVEDGTQGQPFSVSSGKESCAQADWRRRDLVGVIVTITGANANILPPCPYVGKIVLSGVSCSTSSPPPPPPPTLLGRKGECQSRDRGP